MFPNAFNGMTCLVTAGTSGIGRETARLFAASGAATVIVNGRSPESGERVRSEIAEAYPDTEVLFVSADLTDPAQLRDMFASIQAKVGRLDAFVHCGGAQVKPGFFANLDADDDQAHFDGHVRSFMNCCRAVIPMMTEGGSIVAVASDAGKLATPAETLIGAMKAAVIMFCRTLALEVSRQNIRVNVITPSIIADTKSYDRVMATEAGARIFGKAASKAKLGVPTPVDVAPTCVFLASPYSSRLTGQAISINGGISAA
ncbi:SDR family NAD(P)-dependent oxidoreductase [Pseudooceanicola sp.]|uniref:SDR family NAD(P)-dependent oxidoreductase n=1 Tax=Pseudooceanicola sp. TaxID=1914328 RepID=UPI00405819A5